MTHDSLIHDMNYCSVVMRLMRKGVSALSV